MAKLVEVPQDFPRMFFRELEVHLVKDKQAPYAYYTYSHHKFEDDQHLFELLGKTDEDMIKDLIKKFRIPLNSGDKVVFITEYFEGEDSEWDNYRGELENIYEEKIHDHKFNLEKELDEMLGKPTKWVQVYTVP